MKPCPNCAEQVPDHGDYCPYCKSDLTPKPAARTRPASTPYRGLTSVQYLGLGVLTMILGGLIYGLAGSATVLIIFMGIGGFLTTIAAIGLGVAAGLASRD